MYLTVISGTSSRRPLSVRRACSSVGNALTRAARERRHMAIAAPNLARPLSSWIYRPLNDRDGWFSACPLPDGTAAKADIGLGTMVGRSAPIWTRLMAGSTSQQAGIRHSSASDDRRRDISYARMRTTFRALFWLNTGTSIRSGVRPAQFAFRNRGSTSYLQRGPAGS